MGQTGARLAVDIGGTFTDVVLELGDQILTAKVLTTPAAPEEAAAAGVADILARGGISAGEVSLFLHGTTLATNAILERKGAHSALVTTEGFRDVIEIGYESRYDQYNLMIDKPTPLVPRARRLTVLERTDVNGRELTPLDEAGVLALVPELQRLAVESVAIGFLHSYANPAHEQRAGEILAKELPDLSISLSSEVCPEIREYERFTTTTVNAYIRPQIEGYLGRLQQQLAQIVLTCPDPPDDIRGGTNDLRNGHAVPNPPGGIGTRGWSHPGQPSGRGTLARQSDFLRHGRDDGQGLSD